MLLHILNLLSLCTDMFDDLFREKYQDSWQNCGRRELPYRPRAGLSETLWGFLSKYTEII